MKDQIANFRTVKKKKKKNSKMKRTSPTVIAASSLPHRLGAAGYGWTDHICPGLLKTIPIIPVVST